MSVQNGIKITAEDNHMNTAELLNQIRPCDQNRPYIFISYSDLDRELVWNDVLTLQNYGYNIWLDQKNLDNTKPSWKDDALKAISDIDCQLVVFYVSENSLVSENCLRELRHTIAEETTDSHLGPVKFVAVDAQEIGNIINFAERVHASVTNGNESKEIRQKKARTLSRFIREFFNSNNERVRVHPKEEVGRKSEYYSDIITSFPNNTKLFPAGSETLQNTDRSKKEPQNGKTIRYSTGVYVGDVTDGVKTGHGVFTFTNGDIYDGEWKNDRRNGHGVYIYSSKDRYEGEWKDNQKDGYGTYTYSSGNTYNGTWKAGKKHGHGIFSYADGTVYDGNYENGKRCGYGTLTYQNGDVYRGEWKDDKMWGHGVYTWQNGNVYDGTWQNGKKSGSGRLTFYNHDVYDGEFKDNVRCGHGIYSYSDGSVYDGEWKDDIKFGHGIYTRADGTVLEGEWNGKLL